MIKNKSRNSMRLLRHERLRKSVSGTAERPRLAVFRSLKEIYVQVIDDTVFDLDGDVLRQRHRQLAVLALDNDLLVLDLHAGSLGESDGFAS